MSAAFQPDATDLAILRLLVGDATLSAAEIGRELGMTQPATWRRIKRLTDAATLPISNASCAGAS